MPTPMTTITHAPSIQHHNFPRFLRKVLRDNELGDDNSSHDHNKLLAIALHAVLLDSGFIGFESESDEQKASIISLRYTLPRLINSDSNSIETVVFKFQTLGQFVCVYGSLARNGSGLYRVCLDEYRYAPIIDLVRGSDEMSAIDEYSNSMSYPESEVLEFWKIVKDGLVLPLLIDFCDWAGLDPPPCFMRLPTELKLRILEFLPGVDVAKIACVCSELQYLASNNDLWRLKFVEEFGTASSDYYYFYLWKQKFVEKLDLLSVETEAYASTVSL